MIVSRLPDFKAPPDLMATAAPDGNAVHSALYCLTVFQERDRNFVSYHFVPA